MEVIRHPTTGGAPVEFQFRASGSRFLVKNFTSGYITCGILDAEVTIPANTSQVIATRLIPRTSDMTDKVTVTANETSAMGVEVQCLDYWPFRPPALSVWRLASTRSPRTTA